MPHSRGRQPGLSAFLVDARRLRGDGIAASEGFQHSGNTRGEAAGNILRQRVGREPAHVFAFFAGREDDISGNGRDESHIPVCRAREPSVRLVEI